MSPRNNALSHFGPDDDRDRDLSLEEFISKAKNDPILAQYLMKLPLEPQERDLIREVLWVSPEDLIGFVADRLTRRRATLTSLWGGIANLINFGTTVAFSITSLGFVVGSGVNLAIFLGSNILLKLSVIKPYRFNPSATASLVFYGAMTIGWSIPAPLGVGLMRFQEDLRNAVAKEVVMVYDLAEEGAAIEAAHELMGVAEATEQECEDLEREYLALAKVGDPRRHHFYRLAWGTWDPEADLTKFADVPTESLPVCHRARRLRDEAQTALQLAQSDQRDALAKIQESHGESFVSHLEKERPELYSATFDPASGRILSSEKTLTALIELLQRGDSGVKAMMLVPALLSLITSIAAILLTYHYSNLPTVRAGWKIRHAIAHDERLRALLLKFQQEGGRYE